MDERSGHGTGRDAVRDRGGERLVQTREASGILDDELLLRDAVEALSLKNLLLLEAVIENAESAANYDLRRSVPPSHSPCEAQAGR